VGAVGVVALVNLVSLAGADCLVCLVCLDGSANSDGLDCSARSTGRFAG
jgi:hypothetical protein